MTQSRPEIIEVEAHEKDGEVVYEFDGTVQGLPQPTLGQRVALWATVAVGLGVGICLFLFFLTFLVYVVLPVGVILFLVHRVRRWLAAS